MGDRTFLKGYIKLGEDINKGYIIIDRKSGLIIETGIGDINISGEEIYEYDDNHVIESGDFNAHSHPEQSVYTDIVDKKWDLGTWCRNTIYKYSVILKPEHIYLGCCRAFSRMLKFGVTSVMVSFYCHNNMDNKYDYEVIRAAKDTGIRLYFGRMNYDIINEDAYEEKKNSQRSYYESVSTAEKNYINLLNEVELLNVEIAPAVHSIHASTKEAIINAINLGNKYEKLVQFHLSEDNGDVGLSMRLYGCRPIEFLEGLLQNGEVSSLENLVLSDCVWIDDNERNIIKKYNMKVVLNPRMNHRIKTGEARFDRFIQEDVYPYIGTDGEASNDDLSITGEKEFLKKSFKNIDFNVIDNLGNNDFKFKDGYIGDIKIGNYGDIKVTKSGTVKDVFVGGRRVIEDEKLVTMDIENDIEIPLKNLMDVTF